MSAVSSIFHEIQEQGTRVLHIPDLLPEYSVNLRPFVTKLRSTFSDPLSVSHHDCESIVKLSQRVDQILATKASPQDIDLPPEDISNEIVLPEFYGSTLPARRLGIEIVASKATIALFIEPVKTKNPSSKNFSYTLPECTDVALRDFNYFRIFYMARKHSSNADPRIMLDSRVYYIDVKETLHSGLNKLIGMALSNDAYVVTKRPNIGRIPYERDLFQKDTMDSIVPFGQYINNIFYTTLKYLWVLKREPRLIQQEIIQSRKITSPKRGAGSPILSPVEKVTIDYDEMRRIIKVQLAAEIAESFKRNGGYTIPGLVLVKASKIAKAHARCNIKDVKKAAEVRRAATEILQTEGCESPALAALVNEFGNDTTRKKFVQDRSPLQVAQLV